jgi:hypothetical protein
VTGYARQRGKQSVATPKATADKPVWLVPRFGEGIPASLFIRCGLVLSGDGAMRPAPLAVPARVRRVARAPTPQPGRAREPSGAVSRPTGCLPAPASTAISVLGHSLVRAMALCRVGHSGLEPLKAANGRAAIAGGRPAGGRPRPPGLWPPQHGRPPSRRRPSATLGAGSERPVARQTTP